MTEYKNLSGISGVTAYEIGQDRIIIEFKDRTQYLYTYKSAGKIAIEAMKRLAEKGAGLATYVNIHAHNNYEKKMR